MQDYKLTVIFKSGFPSVREFVITQEQFNKLAELPDADWVTVPEPHGVSMLRASEISMMTLVRTSKC